MNNDKRLRSGKIGLAVRLTVGAMWVGILSGLVGCQQDDVNPFEPRKLGQAQRDASRNQEPKDPGALSERYEPWVPRNQRPRGLSVATTKPGVITPGNEPRVPMTLEDVIRRTVVNNLDVKVAGYGPSIESSRITEAEARFDPAFFFNTSAEVTDRATSGTLFSEQTGNPLQPTNNLTIFEQRSVVYTAEAGVKQVLESGAQVQISQRMRRTDSKPSGSLIEPFTESDLILQVTQPLLKDFGGVVNQARIEIARNNARVSLLDFQKAVEEQVSQAEQTYWQLQQAQRDVATIQRLVERSRGTADRMASRTNLDATRLQLAQSQAATEAREGQLVRAQARVRELSDTLKQIMHDADLPVSGAELVETESSGLTSAIKVNLDEQIEAALQYRLELSQQQLQVDNSSITLGAAQNNLLPQLNFVGSLNPNGGEASGGRALKSTWDANLQKTSWSMGLQFEVPIGNREARAIYKRTLDQRTQGVTQLEALQSKVIEDVKRNHREVQTAWDELTYYRKARLAQEKVVTAAQAQLDSGETPTPDFIDRLLTYQAQLAQAEQQESDSLARYNIAISLLERSKGTLLRYNNITLGERGNEKGVKVRMGK